MIIICYIPISNHYVVNLTLILCCMSVIPQLTRKENWKIHKYMGIKQYSPAPPVVEGKCQKGNQKYLETNKN